MSIKPKTPEEVTAAQNHVVQEQKEMIINWINERLILGENRISLHLAKNLEYNIPYEKLSVIVNQVIQEFEEAGWSIQYRNSSGSEFLEITPNITP